MQQPSKIRLTVCVDNSAGRVETERAETARHVEGLDMLTLKERYELAQRAVSTAGGQGAGVVKFALYGQAPTRVEERFLHVEDFSKIGNPDSAVRPHLHVNLSQLLVILSGQGMLILDERAIAFSAPCLVSIPPRAVHSFRIVTPWTGAMLTFSAALVRELGRSEGVFEELLRESYVIPVAGESRRARFLKGTLRHMAEELQLTQKGFRAVLENCLAGLLLVAVRANDEHLGSQDTTRGPDTELVAAFRVLVEERASSRLSLWDYANLLKVTPARLRKACARVTRLPPLQLIKERVLIESKRLLLYSTLTIAEISYAVGFEDPAYFSRFFSRREGMCPSEFRDQKAPL